MGYGGDISWPLLRRIVHEWAGERAELTEVTPLDGGSISTTLLLQTSTSDRAVLKLSQHRVDHRYEREAHQLGVLRDVGVPAPHVYGWKVGDLEDPNSYLLMEFMPGVDLAHAKQQCTSDEYDDLQRQLADMIARMHAQTSDQYCRLMPEQMYLPPGAKPGPGWSAGMCKYASWPAFFREIYDEIWHEAAKVPCLPAKCRKTIAKVHERLDKLLAHDDVPRLVHWDVWHSNVLASPDDSGKWRITALLDPNCKYAHAEAELAYIDLFHTGSPTFLKTYQQRFKLDDAYHRVRRPVYQLYPLINDLRQFGPEYLKPLLIAVERIAALV
jgi:fructosamine-3-kinase